MMIKLILLFSILQLAFGYKILVYSPHMSRSHVTFMAHITEKLAQAGHNVVSLNYFSSFSTDFLQHKKEFFFSIFNIFRCFEI